MTTLPTGETLPEYDEGPADGPVDIDKLRTWLAANRPDSVVGQYGPGREVASQQQRAVVRDVLAALQAVGDATLVKNPTYRALVRQGQDVERLAAGLHKLGHVEAILEADGDVVKAALATIEKLANQPVLVRLDSGNLAVGIPGSPEVYGTEAEASQAEADLEQFQAVQDQLDDPRAILANALLRVHQADEVQAERDNAPYASGRADERHEHLIDSALVLVRIAREAAVLNREQRLDADLDNWMGDDQHGDDLDDEAADERPVGHHQPLPTNGLRFVADLRGWWVGPVGGREWYHVPGCGFIDITNAEKISGPEGTPPYRLTGRVVSATPDHILGITDGGVPVALPRSLVTETADE